ncbi:hypothetical protein C2H96_01680 [Bacillus subtilis]|uniref:hypothetical protein n=1 Tax=Bacillus subtilis TaxID=1423 RepID=UPI00201CE74F|nr:hypothetical protein [Bacillus subtilis]UQZ53290.1 hypothetical protein C2H96_01680 [Bacillus subtilis]UQZ68331.1 hypothetical protein C2H97_18585 [Bacillus subtilis PY79]UQZ72738.1 hypothetical protein C2I05_20550 [Bacillus subtilis]
MKKKEVEINTIGVSHLVYNIIILVLIMSGFIVYSFGGDAEAGNKMNLAATVTSIILAVIAIVLTLIDVAGQRQSIFDLKETADNLTTTAELLKKSNQSANDLIKQAIQRIEELENTKNVMERAIESNMAFVNSVKNGQNSDVSKLADEMIKKNEHYIKIFNVTGRPKVRNEFHRIRNASRLIEIYLREHYEPGESWTDEGLGIEIEEKFPEIIFNNEVIKNLIDHKVLKEKIGDDVIWYTLLAEK